MGVAVRAARPDEAGLLSELALRSKGHWGYDAAFLEACRAELTMDPTACDGIHVVVAAEDGVPTGYVRSEDSSPVGELSELYVEPRAIGRGIGSLLLDHAKAAATAAGLTALVIDADPHAEEFYLRQGAQRVGWVASGSIPGRQLPQLSLPLAPPPSLVRNPR